MSQPQLIFRTDGTWVAVVYQGHLFDTTGEWIGWLDGADVYSHDGSYAGYLSKDNRLLRERVPPYRKQRRPPTERPDFKPPKTVPLPPMFAELSYSIIDVFEEEPHIFGLVSELRADGGEKPLHRLAEADPRLAEQERIRQVDQDLLEDMAHRIIQSYNITEPPVPIEAMAAGLQPGSPGAVERASPDERLFLATQFIERIGQTSWAIERGYCGSEGFAPARTQYAVRALLLPRHWLLKTPDELQHPSALAHRYIVPEETAILRIYDLE